MKELLKSNFITNELVKEFKMKKKIILVLLIICIVFVTTACDCSTKKLKFRSICSDDLFELPFKPDKAIRGGDHTTFTSKYSLIEMKNLISGDNIKSEIFREEFLLITKTLENRKDYYYVAKIFGVNRFVFMQPAEITDNGYFLVPFHLLDLNVSMIDENFEFYSFPFDTEHKTNSKKEDIKSFYEDAGIFDIVENNSSIKIKAKENIFVNRHTLSACEISFSFVEEILTVKYTMLES